MKIAKIEAHAIQKKPVDAKPYWGSRAWGARGKSRARREISSEYPTPYRRRYCYSQTIDTVVVKITTDDGLVGFGEAKAPVAPRVTKAIIDELLTGIVWERIRATISCCGSGCMPGCGCAGIAPASISKRSQALISPFGISPARSHRSPSGSCLAARFEIRFASMRRVCRRSLPKRPEKPSRNWRRRPKRFALADSRD